MFFFFQMAAETWPNKDDLASGVNINKNLLFRYFDLIFIHRENLKGFIGAATIHQVKK